MRVPFSPLNVKPVAGVFRHWPQGVNFSLPGPLGHVGSDSSTLRSGKSRRQNLLMV